MNYIHPHIQSSILYHPQKMINLDQLDPDWTFATNHGLASRAGLVNGDREDSMSDVEIVGDRNLICKCCYEHVNKTPVPLWENSKELEFLGFGFPLFYQFLKSAIILLILSTCSYNAIAIKYALQHNQSLCHPTPNTTDTTTHRLLAATTDNTTNTTSHMSKICYTFMIEIARIEETVTSDEEALRIISFCLHLLALVYFRNRIIKLEEYYDERTTSLSDYSVFIKGIPKMKGIQHKLRQFLRKQFKKPHEIQQITLLPQYHQIEQLQHKKKQVLDTLRIHYDHDDDEQKNEEMAYKLKDLRDIEKRITNAAEATKDHAQKDQLECEKIICVFNTEEQKEQVLQEFQEISKQNKAKYFTEQGAKSMYFKQAPEPQQIYWKNANLPKRKRVLFILLGWGLSLLVLVVVFIVFFLILEKKSLVLEEAIAELAKHPDDEKYKTNYRGALALIYILLFLVVIFDKIVIAGLFHKFTDFQRHSTAAKYQFSFELKMLLGLFFTTALMTLAVQAIRFHNYYSHPYGVIDQQTIMFLMNSFFVPFFWIVNPTRIFKQLKRRLKYGSRSLTQRQANQLMQDQQYDMGKRFAQILEMLWFTYLYSTLIPIGVIITAFGLIFYYWVDKYNLLRRSAVNGQVSGNIINTSISLLDFTLILRPIGSIIFDTQIRDSYKVSTIVMIIVGFVYLLLPKDKLIELLNDEKFRPEAKTYKEVRQNFHRTYHTEHPVYRIIHAEKLSTKMIKKGLLFESSFSGLEMGSSLIGSTSLLQQSTNQIELKLQKIV